MTGYASEKVRLAKDFFVVVRFWIGVESRTTGRTKDEIGSPLRVFNLGAPRAMEFGLSINF